jgi:hypothetical protein
MTSLSSPADRQQDVIWLWSRRHYHGIPSNVEVDPKYSPSRPRSEDLTRELISLHAVLNILQAETKNPESLLHQIQDIQKQDLEQILNGCFQAVRDLDTIREKYRKLSEGQRSVTKLWQRVRFGAGEMQDLDQIRMNVMTQSISLALFLQGVSLGSQWRAERQMAELQEKQQTFIDATGHTAVGNRESTLTTYENDDKEF